MLDFLFAIIELFRSRLRHYKQILVEVGVFQRAVGHFDRKFWMGGDVAPNPTIVGVRKLQCLGYLTVKIA